MKCNVDPITAQKIASLVNTLTLYQGIIAERVATEEDGFFTMKYMKWYNETMDELIDILGPQESLHKFSI